MTILSEQDVVGFFRSANLIAGLLHLGEIAFPADRFLADHISAHHAEIDAQAQAIEDLCLCWDIRFRVTLMDSLRDLFLPDRHDYWTLDTTSLSMKVWRSDRSFELNTSSIRAFKWQCGRALEEMADCLLTSCLSLRIVKSVGRDFPAHGERGTLHPYDLALEIATALQKCVPEDQRWGDTRVILNQMIGRWIESEQVKRALALPTGGIARTLIALLRDRSE